MHPLIAIHAAIVSIIFICFTQVKVRPNITFIGVIGSHSSTSLHLVQSSQCFSVNHDEATMIMLQRNYRKCFGIFSLHACCYCLRSLICIVSLHTWRVFTIWSKWRPIHPKNSTSAFRISMFLFTAKKGLETYNRWPIESFDEIISIIRLNKLSVFNIWNVFNLSSEQMFLRVFFIANCLILLIYYYAKKNIFVSQWFVIFRNYSDQKSKFSY